ncbi:MAG TPA: acyl-CoA dehydratase activase [Planctomycetota bacterium]|nr:acyl-CoA dehydratase activase [Planctomycetota bacterium]
MSKGIHAGIDVGSTATKVVIAGDGSMLASAIAPTGVNSRKTAERLLAEALDNCGRRRDEIRCTVATGYGRRLIGFADRVVSEITAIAQGAGNHGGSRPQNGAPLRTAIDIGGQDSKVIALDESGILRDFIMNDKCAAGTGRFLEVMARALEVELDQLGELSLRAAKVLPVNSLCTVFAESEVISLLSCGENVSDIIAGVHASIAKRLAAMARKIGVHEPVAFVGGPALNVGLRRALQDELGMPLLVPDRPQLVAAYGAAVIAAGIAAGTASGERQ